MIVFFLCFCNVCVCECGRDGFMYCAPTQYNNFLAVFIPVADYVSYGGKDFSIPGIGNDCCRMYDFFCNDWQIDIMYATSEKGKAKTNIDTKRFKRYHPDPSKIKFKLCWTMGEIIQFLEDTARVFDESPRLYDGVVFWFAGRGKRLRKLKDQKAKYTLYDSNGGDIDEYDVQIAFGGDRIPACLFLPKIYFYDVDMCEIKEVDKFDDDQEEELDMERIKEVGKKDMKTI